MADLSSTKTLHLPEPDPTQLKAAHQAADDAGAQIAAFPPPEEWQREFPGQYWERPDGKWGVDYRNPGQSVIDSERASKKVQALIRGWQEVCAETSSRRDALIDKATVKDRTGQVMHIPVLNALRGREKGVVQMVMQRRPTSIYRDGAWWKRDGVRWVKEDRK